MRIAGKIPLIATVAASAAVLLLPSLARSQEPQCGPWRELNAILAAKYHEVQVGVGVLDQTRIMVIFASPDGETWTLTTLDTFGIGCILQSGGSWFQNPVPNSQERPS